MTVNTALPAVTRNVMRDAVKISDKIWSPYLWNFEGSILAFAMFVGPCHHVLARPQVADGGTASDMGGSCE